MAARKVAQAVEAIEPDEPVADEVLAELEKMEAADKLDAETIVAEATDPSSPLHDRFTWDNDEAAHRFRLWQARALLAKYRRYTVSQTTGGTVAYRRYTHVPTLGRSIDTDRAVADFREELIERARRDMANLLTRYRRLGDDTLADLFAEALAR